MKFKLPERDKLVGRTNIRKTGGLFLEWWKYQKDKRAEDQPPVFNLTDDQQVEDTVPLKWFYMQYPTEYDFAIAVFGQWGHWEKLRNSPWFNPHYLAWQTEREQMELAMARKTLLDRAADGDVSAAKKIIDEAKPKRSVGRAKKEDVKKEARLIAEEAEVLKHARAFIQ